VLAQLKKLRFAKPTQHVTAYVVKINRKDLRICEDEQFEDITIEELAEELPDDSPRYIVMSYKYSHSDGRVSYPLLLIYYCPYGSSPELNMLYASSHIFFREKVNLSKAFELRDKEQLTDMWVVEQLGRSYS